MAGKYYTQADIIPSNDKTLTGADFVVYTVSVSAGIHTSEKPFRFCVAGNSSQPNVGMLWDAYKQRKRMNNEVIDPNDFINLVLQCGYVQIAETTFYQLSYD